MGTDYMVTAAEAAELAGVSLSTFRKWKARGLVTEKSVTRGERGAFTLLYDPKEVMQAEAKTRLADPAKQRTRRERGD
jgi:phage terminase Nu1 subunit (DNA packaging protein)